MPRRPLPTVLIVESRPRWTNRLDREQGANPTIRLQWSSGWEVAVNLAHYSAIVWIPAADDFTSALPAEIFAIDDRCRLMIIADVTSDTELRMRELGLRSVWPATVSPSHVVEALSSCVRSEATA